MYIYIPKLSQSQFRDFSAFSILGTLGRCWPTISLLAIVDLARRFSCFLSLGNWKRNRKGESLTRFQKILFCFQKWHYLKSWNHLRHFWCLRFWARFQIQFCGYRWNAQCKWGSLWLNRALCTHKWFLGRECTAWAQIFPMSPSTYVPSGND